LPSNKVIEAMDFLPEMVESNTRIRRG
jgi:hypothetical protein